jgi:hypothetical protein
MVGITGKGLRLGKGEGFKGGEKGGRVYGREELRVGIRGKG